MIQEEILQYNKLCAKFLGAEHYIPKPWYYLPKYKEHYYFKDRYGPNRFTLKMMKFHSDWNWIHEVIQSIKNTTNPKEQYGTTFSTLRREIQVHLGRSNKEAVVEAINQFLIWYSQNKTV